jgi:anthranilate phosphoribosyltransferase
MMVNGIAKYINKVVLKQDLTEEEAARAFQIMMSGGATPAQMAAFLMGLRMKGEVVAEITGGAIAMRAKSAKLRVPAEIADVTVDTCGTGGDGAHTYNISTAVGFVLAGAGVPVVKHGNRSVSSRSGSADVLKALHVNIMSEMPYIERSLAEAGICFMMAPRFHAAMRHIAPVRQELAMRTIFNLLGPLSNPAAPKRQLVGVYDKALVEPLAEVLKNLGLTHAWVVHGEDGLDELTTTGKTFVAELKDGAINTFNITPEDAGIARATLDDLKGGDALHNAQAMRKLFSGEEGAYRDIVLLNSAAGLIVAGKAADLKEGVALAAKAIDEGRAKKALEKLVEVTSEQVLEERE